MTSTNPSSGPAWLAAFAALGSLTFSAWSFSRYDAPLRELQVTLDQQQTALNSQTHGLQGQQNSLNAQQKELNEQQKLLNSLAISSADLGKKLDSYERVIKWADATSAMSTNLSAKAFIEEHGRFTDAGSPDTHLLNCGISFTQQSSNPMTVDAVEVTLDVTDTSVLGLLQKGQDLVLNKPEETGALKWRRIFVQRKALASFLGRAKRDYPSLKLSELPWETDPKGWESTLSSFPKGTGDSRTWEAIVESGKLGYARLQVRFYYWMQGDDGSKIGGHCWFNATQVLTSLPPIGGK